MRSLNRFIWGTLILFYLYVLLGIFLQGPYLK